MITASLSLSLRTDLLLPPFSQFFTSSSPITNWQREIRKRHISCINWICVKYRVCISNERVQWKNLTCDNCAQSLGYRLMASTAEVLCAGVSRDCLAGPLQRDRQKAFHVCSSVSATSIGPGPSTALLGPGTGLSLSISFSEWMAVGSISRVSQ